MATCYTYQLKRTADIFRTDYTPAYGEPLYVVDTNELYIGDGSTAGGILLVSQDTVLGRSDLDTAGTVTVSDGDGSISESVITISGNDLSVPGSMLVDTISEYTTGAGVTIDGALSGVTTLGAEKVIIDGTTAPGLLVGTSTPIGSAGDSRIDIITSDDPLETYHHGIRVQAGIQSAELIHGYNINGEHVIELNTNSDDGGVFTLRSGGEVSAFHFGTPSGGPFAVMGGGFSDRIGSAMVSVLGDLAMSAGTTATLDTIAAASGGTVTFDDELSVGGTTPSAPTAGQVLIGGGYVRLASGLTLSGGTISDGTGTVRFDDQLDLNGNGAIDVGALAGVTTLTASGGVVTIDDDVTISSSTAGRRVIIGGLNNTNPATAASLELLESSTGTFGAFGSAGTLGFRWHYNGTTNEVKLQASATAGAFDILTVQREDRDVVLASGVDLVLSGGVISDSTGTVTIDDDVTILGAVVIDTPGATGVRTLSGIGGSTTQIRSGSSSNFLQLLNSGGASLGYVGSTSAGVVTVYDDALVGLASFSSSAISLSVPLETGGNAIQSSTGTITLDDNVTLNGSFSTVSSALIDLDVQDNIADVFKVEQGADPYIRVSTTNGSEEVRLGNTTTTPNIVLDSLPTSATGLPTGALWNDSGTVKVA